MPSDKSLWYRLGYALERARQAPAQGKRTLASLKERRSPEPPEPRATNPAQWPTADELLASGAVALAAKALDAWRPRRKTGPVHLLKAGAAGAAAALLVELVRPFLAGRAELPSLDSDTAEHMLVGAGQGILYGAVVEPRVPGHSVVKGTLYGSAEYAMDPAGGLGRVMGSHTPLRRIPVLGHLLSDLDPHDRTYLEHVAFGIALAVLYGSSPASNGILSEEEE